MLAPNERTVAAAPRPRTASRPTPEKEVVVINAMMRLASSEIESAMGG
jgi:hypothetical protein